MKNLSLSMQIWLVFAAITLSISILLSILFPWILRDFFTKEMYATIESAQSSMLGDYTSSFSRYMWETTFSSNQLQDIRAVNHIIVMDRNREILAPRLPLSFLNKVKTEIQNQTINSQRYRGQIGDQKIFYVITRGTLWGEDVFLISFMWDDYREDLANTLFVRLALIMGLVFILSWIPSLGLARYLSNPIVDLEKRVKRLASRDWHEPVKVKRKDEIGELAKTIEYLRSQLVRWDELEQSFLQKISHELKTPVMTIRSYAQAIKDNIYPKGNLAMTVTVIEEEACRLEKCIHDLLFMTKIDYLTSHKLSQEIVDLDILIRDVAGRFYCRRRDVNWSLELSAVKIRGNPDHWRVVLENLFDNQVRYANNNIVTCLKQDESSKNIALLHIWNDGPTIEPEILSFLFNQFKKGYKGEFGLGLAIARRIVSLYNSNIWVKNEEKGVSFFLEITAAG